MPPKVGDILTITVTVRAVTNMASGISYVVVPASNSETWMAMSIKDEDIVSVFHVEDKK